MTGPDWPKVKEIVAEALELSGAERDAYLDAACEGDEALRIEVDGLLNAHHRAAGFLDSPSSPPDQLDHLDHLGPYRIRRVLAEGGMGTVYEAVRDDEGISLRVAIKIVRQGLKNPKLVDSFRNEQQILARLRHPGIASLMDWGTTPGGRRYVVMEFVEGEAVDAYCEARNLTPGARLRLFLRILEAVAYAHQNFVAHGDIKPSNILVTPEGHAKLLDFGIARLLNAKDDVGSALQAFTPAYASPGQLRREPLTVASDLYSLGVLLCRMLSGGEPYVVSAGTREDILASIESQVPRTPSAIAPGRRISKELDAIVLKAIHSDPGKRYRSVNGLIDDIQAYLEGRPVAAYAKNPLYRLRKTLARHQLAAAAGVLLFVALSAGISAALSQGLKAQRRFEQVRDLVKYVVFDLNEALAELPRSTAVRADVVRHATSYLDQLRVDGGDDELKMELARSYIQLGDVLGRPSVPNLGDTTGALESYRKAMDLLEGLASSRGAEAKSQQILANMRYSAALKAAGDFRAALEREEAALAMNLELQAANPADSARQFSLAYNYTLIGATLWHLGRWDQALEARKKALALYQQVVQAQPRDIARQQGLSLAYNRLALSESARGNHSQAIEAQTRALQIYEDLAQRHPENLSIRRGLATAQHYMGFVLLEGGELAQAELYFEKAIALREQTVNEDPRDVRNRSFLATHQWQLGRCALRRKRMDRAVELTRQSLQLRRELAAKDGANAGAKAEVAEALSSLGDVYSATRQPALAAAAYREAESIYRAIHAQGRLAAVEVADLERVTKLLQSPANGTP